MCVCACVCGAIKGGVCNELFTSTYKCRCDFIHTHAECRALASWFMYIIRPVLYIYLNQYSKSCSLV